MAPPPRAALFLFLSFAASATTAWARGGGSDPDPDADGGDATTKPDLRERGLVAAKLWCLAVVFAGTLAGGVSPYFMRWNEAFLALGTQFAGGVFLGTALMHFLSDADETFGDLLPDSGYPYAFMLACAGYVVTMLADCVIAHVVSRGRHEGGVGSAARRDQGRRMEGALDHQPAQGLRCDRHGDRAAPDAPQPAPDLVLRLRLRHLQPRRRGHRHRHRRHHAGPGGRLDLRRLHGPRHRHLHLRLYQPPPLQGVQAPEAGGVGVGLATGP